MNSKCCALPVNDHTLASGLNIVSFGVIRRLGKGMLPEKFQQYIFYFVQSYDTVLLKGRRAHAIPKHLFIAELIKKMLM